MSVSWQRDPDDDPQAPARGVIYNTFFGVIAWGVICGVVLFFLLNGWSF